MADSKGVSGDVPQEEPEDDEPANAANRTENDEAGMSIDQSNDDNVPSVGKESTNGDDIEGSSSTSNVSDRSAKLASSASKPGNQDVKSKEDESRPQEEAAAEQKDGKSSGGSTNEKGSSKKQGRKSSKSSATQKESEGPVHNGNQSRQQATTSRPAEKPHSMEESEEFLKDSYSDNNDTLLAMNFNQVGLYPSDIWIMFGRL